MFFQNRTRDSSAHRTGSSSTSSTGSAMNSKSSGFDRRQLGNRLRPARGKPRIDRGQQIKEDENERREQLRNVQIMRVVTAKLQHRPHHYGDEENRDVR